MRIQLLKVSKDGVKLTNTDAYFNVHVKYTDPNDPEHKKLIDRSSNIIKGKTKDGVFNITDENLRNMPEGFDFPGTPGGYTGVIILDVIEVVVDNKTSETYTISPTSKDITLRYEQGKLVEYSQFSDTQVITNYVTDDAMRQIYEWAISKSKGENYALPDYINEDELDAWIKKQRSRNY